MAFLHMAVHSVLYVLCVEREIKRGQLLNKTQDQFFINLAQFLHT